MRLYAVLCYAIAATAETGGLVVPQVLDMCGRNPVEADRSDVRGIRPIPDDRFRPNVEACPPIDPERQVGPQRRAPATTMIQTPAREPCPNCETTSPTNARLAGLVSRFAPSATRETPRQAVVRHRAIRAIR
jgi:hypothetical protein